MKHIMLITYSFDTDYVSDSRDTEKEAIDLMNDYLIKEVQTVTEEQDYTPFVLECDETEKILIYEDACLFDDDEIPDYRKYNHAIYKVIEETHYADPDKKEEGLTNERLLEILGAIVDNAMGCSESAVARAVLRDAGMTDTEMLQCGFDWLLDLE